jgi:hypothetical protein
MDAVQKQIVTLTHRVDGLYQKIDQLSCQLTESITEIKQQSQPNADSSVSTSRMRLHNHRGQSLLDSVMEHKDVLVDSRTELSNSPQNSENPISCDIQVQRLTAQLTAAYNRIAALEEQLLARRIHS